MFTGFRRNFIFSRLQYDELDAVENSLTFDSLLPSYGYTLHMSVISTTSHLLSNTVLVSIGEFIDSLYILVVI